MSFSPGSRLGPYEIAAPLGAGGMGEVYRARDTRLGRDVAIKVLPPDLTSTPEARARFEREAHAISHLNHPSICAVHDVGREGEIDYLVMELVSGGSLRDRMTRKPLPLEQVLDLGVQIADALEAAHARGIVHRGLRPENVLLTEQGHVKVTGFGLTTPGQTVGAAAYMSPEQARGEEVDARSDAFSLGAVLYEMTSGHRAFEGSTAAAIFGTILDRTPAPVSVLRKGVPAELDRIIGKALEKDRELRYQTAGEVRSDLKRLERDLESSRAHAAGAGGRPGSRARAGAAVALPALVIARRRLIRIAWIAAACLAFASAIFVATRLAHQESARRAVRLSLEAPAALLEMHSPRISPDGRFIAFIGIDSTDVRLYVRPMKAPAARLLPGTEGSGRPFWSPNSRYIGFVSGKKLKTIEVAGGQPVTIGDDLINGDGSWGATGTILLDGDVNIRAISTSGGQPAPVAWPDRSRGESVCTWPEFLPDGRHFIYLGGIGGRPDSTALRCGRLGSKESKLLAIGAFSRVMYSPPGYLLYLRGRTLLAQPFDSERLRLKGDAFPVVGDVLEADLAGNTEISTSATGALVYLAEFAKLDKSQLAWVDRAGMEIRRVGSPARYGWTPSLSPDEKRLAAPIAAPGENSCDIWVMDIERDVAARLTSDPGNDGFPVWSADGATIYFGAMRGGRDSRVWQKSAGGLGEERELPMPPGVALPRATTPDGRYLLASVCPEGGKFDIAEVSLDANPRTAALGIQSRGLGEGLLNLSLSADGKWIAYASDETGRSEVYVVDFPDLKGKWRLSTDGGFLPKWGRDGRELFYLAPGGQEDLVLGWTPRSVEVTTTPSFRAGKPVRILPNISDVWLLEPSSGGRRFLVGAIAKEQSLPPFQVVLNWPATVGRE